MSKDVKSASPVLSKGVRGQTVAPLTRSIVINKNGLETDDDVPTPPPTPPPVSELTSDDFLAVYRADCSGRTATKHKCQHVFVAAFAPGFAAATTPYSLVDVAEGTGQNQRTGTQIACRSLALRFHAKWYGSNSSANNAQLQALADPPPVRVVIAWDKMPLVQGSAGVEPSPIWAEDALLPTGMGALMLTGLLGTSTNSVAAYNEDTHGTRYQIIYDKLHMPTVLNYIGNAGGSSAATMAQSLYWNIYEDLKCKKQTYSTTGSGSYVDHRLLMWVMIDSSTGGAATVNANFSGNVVYEDLEQ